MRHGAVGSKPGPYGYMSTLFRHILAQDEPRSGVAIKLEDEL
jgi:hypothetical protein